MADARFDRAVDRHKLVALILGPVWCLLVAYFDVNGDPAWSGWALDILSVYSSIFAPWFCMVAFLGYGRRRSGRMVGCSGTSPPPPIPSTSSTRP